VSTQRKKPLKGAKKISAAALGVTFSRTTDARKRILD
jgi:hypothetical protein